MPLFFEANRGQTDASAQFLARGRDFNFLISPTGAQIVLRGTVAGPATARMQFLGANPRASIRGDAALSGKINYLIGNDPAQWHAGVPTFAKVRVDGIYPGIGLVYYGNQQQLEYDFEVAPGANPDIIKIRFDGVDKIRINPDGKLVLSLKGGEIRQPRPVLYQMLNSVRREINGGYRLVDARTVAFAVGDYDHDQSLLIDPTLLYSTYFGGSAGDTAWAVKLDTNGFIYMAGQTFSPNYAAGAPISTAGAFQPNYQGGNLAGDAFVAKFSNLAQDLVYFTYLGGSGNDKAAALAVDDLGHVYIAGYTDSTNFPTANALYPNISGKLIPQLGNYPVDAFVAELDGDGANLIYSTYLGGNSVDMANGIAIDASGDAFVTGVTFSTNFPVKSPVPYQLAGTTNLYLNRLACTNTVYFNANAFIAEIAPGGSNLVYSTYFGGNNYDAGTGIAIDSSNYIYVTGYTASTNFPTANAISQQLVQTNFIGTTNQVVITNYFNGYLLNGLTNTTGNFDAFVAKFAPSGTNLVYSTFLGGTNNDQAYAIAVDTNGAAYVTGWTVSTNFPNTLANTNLYNGLTNNLYYGYSVVTNVFLAKITNGAQAGIAYSTVFGGTHFGIDIGYGVALDPAGDVFVVGSTSSTNFPTVNVPGFLSATNSGKTDVFVTAFNTDATAVLYSTYLGGKDNDFGYGIAADATNAYIVGQTLSTNFVIYAGSQTTRNGSNDAFLAAIMLTVPPPEIFTNSEPVSQTNAVGSTVEFSINGTAYPPYFFQWQIVGTNGVGTNLVDGGNISGATNYLLTISPAGVTNSGSYWIIVTNYGGAVTSSIAVLVITNVPPAITAQPTDELVGLGATATFSVTATGTTPLIYQWQLNGTNLVKGTNLVDGGIFDGVTNSTLTITNVQPGDAGNYSVIVTNLAGSVTSSNAALTVLTLPQITNQPVGQSNSVGATVTFSVGAVGQVPLRFHWQFNGINLANSGQISGATNDTLAISNAQTTNSGSYSVIVSNLVGSVTSSNAVLLVTNIPPTITVQPTNQTVGVGTTATLAVVATGTAPLHYQWQTNGVNLANGGSISGATNAILTISTVTTNNGGNYSVIITNPGGSVTSSNAVLTVLAAPVITVQPTNQTIAVGITATFAVTAIGQAPLSYHWQQNGVNLVNGGNISGATSTNLIISSAQVTNSADYTVIITNVVGSVTSSNAVLLVTNIPPAITVQPTNQTVVVTSNVTFVVIATGTLPLNYQWQFNGTNLVNGGNISGTTTNVLKLSPAQLTNSGIYSVIITNAGGSVTSSNAVLTVASSPVIVLQPTNQSIAVGTTATFVVTAVGTVPLRYQWQMNGLNLVNGGQVNGATTTSLTINNAQTNNSGTYTVIITNSAGSVLSSNAVLTVSNAPPLITVQPTNQTAEVGAVVVLAVSATGTAPLSYQWQVDGTNLMDGGQFSGAISNVLTISNAQLTNSGTYTVIITNIAGSMTSSNAVLTVGPLSFAQVVAAGGGNFILSGVGGAIDGTYYVLATTNLTLPLTNWTAIATDQFDGLGDFIFTNVAQTNAPQVFYILKQP